MWYRVGSLIAILFIAAPLAQAQTEAERLTQQDRRVEEQKRDELKPSEVTAPPVTVPGQAQPPVPIGALPIYFLEVSRRFVTFHYDLAKAAVVMRGVDEQYINLEAQTAYLQEQRLLPPRCAVTFDPKAPLRKGLFAVVLARTLNVRGGVFYHLFPSSQRYALKELVHQGILSPGYPSDLVSGQEFVASVARAVEQIAREQQRPRPPQRREGS